MSTIVGEIMELRSSALHWLDAGEAGTRIAPRVMPNPYDALPGCPVDSAALLVCLTWPICAGTSSHQNWSNTDLDNQSCPKGECSIAVGRNLDTAFHALPSVCGGIR